MEKEIINLLQSEKVPYEISKGNEGARNFANIFCRWCKKIDVGINARILTMTIDLSNGHGICENCGYKKLFEKKLKYE